MWQSVTIEVPYRVLPDVLAHDQAPEAPTFCAQARQEPTTSAGGLSLNRIKRIIVPGSLNSQGSYSIHCFGERQQRCAAFIPTVCLLGGL